MKLYHDYVIFKVKSLVRESVNKGVMELKMAGQDFDPQRNATICGEVICVPKALSRTPIMISREHNGAPAYGCSKPNPKAQYLVEMYESPPFVFYHLNDIELIVEVGDKIYFEFNTLLNEKNLIDEQASINSLGVMEYEYILKVRYDQIICTVRQGFIIMVGGFVLVEPDVESWDDILIPTYYPSSITHDKAVQKPKDQWLTKKARPENSYLRGRVVNVGKNIGGDPCEIQQGDLIVYKPNADWLVEVEGKEYFVMRQQYIEGVLTGE